MLIDDYERDGDAVLRTLALESRVDAARAIVNRRRPEHRAWCARVFGAALPPPEHPDRERRLDALVAATEVRPAIKGWYVEWVIETRFGPIDRELRMLTTWHADLGRYRVWGFDTNPQSPPGTVEAEARFEGDEFVMEWKESRGPRGERGIFRNRMRMESPGVLVTHSEAEPEGRGLVVLGVWRHRRVGTAPEAAGGAASGRGACEAGGPELEREEAAGP